MKKVQSMLLLASFGLLASVGSCNKNPKVKQIDQGFESHYGYKTGSYWIYKDSLTGDIDSFSVYAHDFHNEAIDNSGYTYDIINIFIRSFPLGNHADDSMQIRLGLQEKVLTQKYGLKDRPSTYTFQTTLYPFSEAATHSGQLKLSSIAINGNTYTNVIAYNAMMDNYLNDWFYFNEEKGIIKMRITTNGVLKRVWELQSARIIH